MHPRTRFDRWLPALAFGLAVGFWWPDLHLAARAVSLSGPAGMVVGVDPETGRLGPPTAEQSARLTALRETRLGTRAARPAPVHRPDGSVSLDVRSWMREYSLVRVGADGRIRFGCVDDAKTARRALADPSLAPAGLEER